MENERNPRLEVRNIFSSDFEKGFPVGTFDIGDRYYYTRLKTHRFHIKKECPYCNKTGNIEYKGAIFPCPKCHGNKDYIEVKEKIVVNSHDDENVIRSKIIMTNRNESREIYYTDNFIGIVICRLDNGENNYFKDKEEAQAACDIWNKENSVKERLEKYSVMEKL